MGKAKRRSLLAKIFPRSSLRRSTGLLIITCFLSSAFFSVLVFTNADYVIGVFDYLTSFIPISRSDSKLIAVTTRQPIIQKKRTLSTYDENRIYNDFNYLNPSTLTYENRTYSNNVQVLFRLPKKTPIFALLLIFHGCSRTANDWFNTIERQRIIGAAIDLGYGCLAFQATDDFSRCWSNEVDMSSNNDVEMVWTGLKGFYNEYPKLESLPRFTFGSSSGGIFSSIFAINPRYKIQGQIIFISIVLPEIVQTRVKKEGYPPTAWIYMPRDIEFASEARINDSKRVFAEENIPHISYIIEPLCVTSTIFHERIPTITKETSLYIFYRLQQNHWLDPQNYLKYNPRRKNTWQEFLLIPVNKTLISTDISKNLNEHKTILPDFFNTLYGEHEISFERSFEALQWHKNIYDNKTKSVL
ncbi:unnamed protein product [Adineta steineri]|uniref:Uncharacterized protein n=1 Tax=Adineta steineri TaxID=433720 RepID=A0A813Q8T0_9BILA|nr:unnamed protein product [Adineta steineri]